MLSSLLFGLYTEELVARVKRLGKGRKVGAEDVCILMYADDIILLRENTENLQEVLDKVTEYGIDFSVQFSVEKSAIMVINGMEKDKERSSRVGGGIMKRANEYKYLGITLNEKGCEKARRKIVCKANQWYGRLASVARQRENKHEVIRDVRKRIAVPSIPYDIKLE